MLHQITEVTQNKIKIDVNNLHISVEGIISQYQTVVSVVTEK
jgi:hypothetical protein